MPAPQLSCKTEGPRLSSLPTSQIDIPFLLTTHLSACTPCGGLLHPHNSHPLVCWLADGTDLPSHVIPGISLQIGEPTCEKRDLIEEEATSPQRAL